MADLKDKTQDSNQDNSKKNSANQIAVTKGDKGCRKDC